MSLQSGSMYVEEENVLSVCPLGLTLGGFCSLVCAWWSLALAEWWLHTGGTDSLTHLCWWSLV